MDSIGDTTGRVKKKGGNSPGNYNWQDKQKAPDWREEQRKQKTDRKLTAGRTSARRQDSTLGGAKSLGGAIIHTGTCRKDQASNDDPTASSAGGYLKGQCNDEQVCWLMSCR